MESSNRPRKRKARLLIPLGLVGLCLLVVAASALSNLGLPQHSSTVDRLSDLEKARLAEVFHLRDSLGDAAWPGWGQADIPLIVYNEEYAFLVGYPDPPDGWMKVPSLEVRGGPWEKVPGDDFVGRPYYRSPLTDPEKTPEGFTVLVGDRWVATFQTREFGEVEFYRGFRAELPPIISSIVPVRLAWALLMGRTDSYIAALEHESFHAYQGILNGGRLAEAEQSFRVEETYPFDTMAEPWRQEMELLLQAALAEDVSEARQLARQFLQMRANRRGGLSAQQINFERLREWEEGLAKYAELEITRLAGTTADYQPVTGIAADPDFQFYRGQQQFWTAQLKEATKTAGRSGDTRFYYSGNALAVVLDRLLPGWKERALPGGEFPEDLLLEAVK
jgi:hypothetical protein